MVAGSLWERRQNALITERLLLGLPVHTNCSPLDIPAERVLII
jgi:hypothetical protein